MKPEWPAQVALGRFLLNLKDSTTGNSVCSRPQRAGLNLTSSSISFPWQAAWDPSHILSMEAHPHLGGGRGDGPRDDPCASI